MRNEYKATVMIVPILFGLFYAGLGAGIQISWVYPYDNFTEMYEDSDIVIRGVVRESHQSLFKWETTHQVTILEMIKGEKPAHIISVPQKGGQYLPGKIVESSSFPLYHKGDELILFLKSSSKSHEVNYYYVSGPQRSYKVLNDKVYPSGTYYMPQMNSNGTDTSTFIEYLKTIG